MDGSDRNEILQRLTKIEVLIERDVMALNRRIGALETRIELLGADHEKRIRKNEQLLLKGAGVVGSIIVVIGIIKLFL